MTLLRDIAMVGLYELGQALRTRLLQVVILAYTVTIFASDLVFVQALRLAETTVAMQLGLPGTEKPGTLLHHLTDSGTVRAMLVDAVGSEELAARLFDLPLLGVWAGVVAMTALPVVMLAGTAGSLAGEVQSRSVRYLVLRTERLAIVLGKFLGTTFLAALAGAGGIAGTVVVGEVWMVEQNPFAVAAAAGSLGLRGLAYALPYGALGLAVSQWVPSRNGARVLAIVAWIACVIAGAWIEATPSSSPVGVMRGLAAWWLPTTGWTSLWADTGTELAAALSRVGVITLAWIAAGFVRFHGRDL